MVLGPGVVSSYGSLCGIVYNVWLHSNEGFLAGLWCVVSLTVPVLSVPAVLRHHKVGRDLWWDMMKGFMLAVWMTLLMFMVLFMFVTCDGVFADQARMREGPRGLREEGGRSAE